MEFPHRAPTVTASRNTWGPAAPPPKRSGILVMTHQSSFDIRNACDFLNKMVLPQYKDFT